MAHTMLPVFCHKKKTPRDGIVTAGLEHVHPFEGGVNFALVLFLFYLYCFPTKYWQKLQT